MLFRNNHRYNKGVSHEIPLYVGLEEDRKIIEWTNEFKYLGVIYTNNLSFDKHMLNNISKARRKINLLKAMACTEYGCDTETLVRYVSTCILPVLEYGSLVLTSGRTLQSTWNKYESIIPQALKIAYGLPQSTRNQAVLLEAGLKPLRFRAEQAAMTYFSKIFTRHENHPLHSEMEEAKIGVTRYHYRHGCHKISNKNMVRANKDKEHRDIPLDFQPWAQRTYIDFFNNPRLCQFINSPRIEIDYEPPIDKPYRHNTKFITEELTKAKKLLTESEKEEVCKKYSKLHKHTISKAPIAIYTDASVNPKTNKATYACVTYRYGDEYSPWCIQKRISDFSGSMTTELYAIAAAVSLVKIAAQSNLFKFTNRKYFFIGTDSLSGIRALSNTENPDNHFCILRIHQILEELEAEFNINGTIFWCPSHIGIEGNERADQLAGDAMNRNLNVEESELPLSLIKSHIRSSIDSSWKDTTAVSNAYSYVNHKQTKFKFPKAKRHLQVILARIRHNTYALCPHRCQNYCNLCDSPFNSGHYLISCPGTAPKFKFLKEKLSDEEFSLPEETQAGLILSRIPPDDYGDFFKILEKYPPQRYCNDHPLRKAGNFFCKFMPE